MPDTRGRPLPSEVLTALKDPSIATWLRNFIVQQASSTSIGRYPGNGSAQNDNYVYPDAADANFPYNFDYEIPNNFQRIVSARLSFKIRPYRTYSSITLSSTGTESATHTHSTGNESGHTHSHNHSLLPQNIAGAGTMAWNNANPGILAVTNLVPNADTTSIQSNAQASSGHTHGNTNTESATHTHSVSGSTTLGIAEDVAPNNPGITVKVDGTDVTAAIGGPFNADMVEIDVSQVLKTSAKVWHVMSLQPNQRVRITGILRISYLVDSRLAQ